MASNGSLGTGDPQNALISLSSNYVILALKHLSLIFQRYPQYPINYGSASQDAYLPFMLSHLEFKTVAEWFKTELLHF